MADEDVFNIPTVDELFAAGVHYAHAPRRWNPAMEPYIFDRVNGMHILDLEKTREALKEACVFLRKRASKDDKILFVGLRRISADLVEREAKRCGAFYMADRWLGGLLTNFSQIHKNVGKLKELEEGLASGEFDYYTKKERLDIRREIEKLEDLMGGIREMDDLPDVLVLASAKRARTAVEEAKKEDIPVVAIVDTDTDPRDIDFPIPGNDDSLKSLQMLIPTLSTAVGLGYGKISAQDVKESREKKSSEKKGSSWEQLPTRVQNALEEKGVSSLEDLAKLNKEQLLDIKGIGKKSLEEIESVLGT
ncbi:MAG: 30S ribosomal protein S2 [Patescibacteria group bacterium]